MRAWIKYKGLKQELDGKGNVIDGGVPNEEHHYTRFGKEIPHIEMEINILKYFNCDEEKGAYIASCLDSDPKIICKLGEETKKAVKRIKEISAERLNANKGKEKYQHNIPTEKIDIDKLKEELRIELKEELKKEVKPKKEMIRENNENPKINNSKKVE